MSELTLSHVLERDVDLLLAEELKCCGHFRRFFVDALGLPPMAKVATVQQSKRLHHGRREVDVALIYEIDGGSTVTVLIENKLETPEQPEQAETYRREAERVAAESGGVARIILCSSQAYAAKNQMFARKFDAHLSYETLRSYFATGETDLTLERRRHRVELLEQAIERHRRGYVERPVVAIGAFNKRYVALAAEMAPQLKPGAAMLKEARPSESKTQIFSSDILPRWPFLPKMRLVHQLRAGNVNFCLAGWKQRQDAIKATFDVVIDAGPIFLDTSPKGALMFRVGTPMVDNMRDFETQRAAASKGINAASQLLAWVLGNEARFAAWSRL